MAFDLKKRKSHNRFTRVDSAVRKREGNLLWGNRWLTSTTFYNIHEDTLCLVINTVIFHAELSMTEEVLWVFPQWHMTHELLQSLWPLYYILSNCHMSKQLWGHDIVVTHLVSLVLTPDCYLHKERCGQQFFKYPTENKYWQDKRDAVVFSVNGCE